MRKVNNVKLGAIFLATLMLFEPMARAAQFVNYASNNINFSGIDTKSLKGRDFMMTQFNPDWVEFLKFEMARNEVSKSKTEELPMLESLVGDDDIDFLKKVMLQAPDGGPDQPEVQSFSPIDVSDMVDPFTGDFSYNIPLMDVDGYPLNIAYNAGVTMDQEASWVGLGWNLNPGVVNRNLRGLPDDYNGTEEIEKEMRIRPNRTTQLSVGTDIEAAGVGASADVSGSIIFNNYDGISSTFSVGVQLPILDKWGLAGGLSLTGSSSDGASISPSVSLKGVAPDVNLGKLNIGVPYNSRAGLTQMTISYSRPSLKAINEAKATGITSNYRGGINSSASFNFGMTSFSPSTRGDMSTAGFTARVKLGPDVLSTDGSMTFTFAYSSTWLKERFTEKRAYGYGYLQNGQRDKNALLDFSRENDGMFGVNTPALPLPVLTYDIFSVQGQGISGSFRPVRLDLGYVFDPYAESKSNNGSIGGEFNVGGTAKAGIDINYSHSKSHSGVWDKGNNAKNVIGFGNQQVFFREAGEFSVQNEMNHFNSIGGFNPVFLTNSDHKSLQTMLTGQTGTIPLSNFTRSPNPKRNKVMTTLTIGEVRNGYGIQEFHPSSYAATNALSHQIGEFTVLNTEGTRYVYGLPAYSFFQSDYSFAVNGRPSGYECQHGLINYSDQNISSDKIVGDAIGIDNFMERETKPAFAHSYLLTSILNSDYVDADNIAGPSKGDLGGYLILDYEQLNGPFKWRNPVHEKKAFFNEGMNTVDEDQRAHFMYGEKEIWYVKRILSKNHIAVFYTSPREDVVSVYDKNGGVNPNGVAMRKLDSISLYSLPEYEMFGNQSTPIKTVHFVYDYSLCPNPYNINPANGKLTLRSIFFTYERSRKGEYNAYRFNYSSWNPSYNMKFVDRWGNFQNPEGPYSCDDVTDGGRRPWDYPYVLTNKDTVDLNASAWNLTQIYLPSGGSIEISYESDDYGFVQHKPVAQMYDLVDVGNMLEIDMGFYSSSTFNPIDQNPYVTIKMDLNSTKDDYCKIGEEIYFRVLLNITGNSRKSEYVPCYAIVKGLEELPNNELKIFLEPAVIKFAGIPTMQHPFVVAGINFSRMHLPREIPPSNSAILPDEVPGMGFIQALVGAFTSVNELLIGVNAFLRAAQISNSLDVEKSHVRLNKPNGTRLGGGHRVKEVRIHDAWDQMSGINNSNFYYGQRYEYKLENGRSSGVASYEPQIGGDENVWRKPLPYISKEVVLAPDELNMQFEPLGEQYFPSPIVGYSRVQISNLDRNNVNRTATGYVVHEFYTAKDYPTIARRTNASIKDSEIKKFFFLFGGTYANYLSASQGFVIETNNMHGMAKSQTVYAQGNSAPLTRVEYEYFDSYNPSFGFRVLNNNLTTIEKNGNISNGIIGINYDAVFDFRESIQNAFSASTDFNLNYIAPFIFLPMMLGQVNSNATEFRSSSFVKVIERFGMQKRTVAKDLGSIVATENLAWDAETGEILVTKTKTNFEDDIYSFTYPAHWHYDQMGQAYRNVGKWFVYIPSMIPTAPAQLGCETIRLFNLLYFNNGYNGQLNSNHFSKGDEVMIVMENNSHFKAWVTEASHAGIRVLNKQGVPVEGSVQQVKILRSGRRNLQTTPVGSIVLRENPITSLTGNVFEKVLQAGAVEYSDEWKTFCECFINGNQELNTTNPYVLGLRGTWRPKASYVHLSSRTQDFDEGNSNIRHDGMFTSFTPFYRLQNGKWVIDKKDWTYTSSVVEFSPFGQALETIDALNRFSSSMYGYNQTLPIAVAANTRYRQLGFDGFEDYSFDNCSDNHFRIAENHHAQISSTESHTGKNSLKVSGNSTVRFSASLIAPCDTQNPVFESCPLQLVCKSQLMAAPVPGHSQIHFSIQFGEQPYTYSFESSNADVQYSIENGIIIISGPSQLFYNGLLGLILTVTDQTGCNQSFEIKKYLCLPE